MCFLFFLPSSQLNWWLFQSIRINSIDVYLLSAYLLMIPLATVCVAMIQLRRITRQSVTNQLEKTTKEKTSDLWHLSGRVLRRTTQRLYHVSQSPGRDLNTWSPESFSSPILLFLFFLVIYSTILSFCPHGLSVFTLIATSLQPLSPSFLSLIFLIFSSFPIFSYLFHFNSIYSTWIKPDIQSSVAMVQAVIRWPLIAEGRVWSLTNLGGICGKQHDNRTRISTNTSIFFLSVSLQQCPRTHSTIYDQRYS